MNASGALNACKSNDEPGCLHPGISGRRVSNTWVTYPADWDNEWKHWLIPDTLSEIKAIRKGSLGPLGEGLAAHQLVGEVKAHQGEDG
jgi:hypothetical protein